MALEYVLGNFLNGAVTMRNLPITKGTDKVTRDIDGGGMEVEVSLNLLSDAVKNNWRNTFKPLARFVALIDTAKAWNDPTAVLYAGFINKVNAPVGKGFIRLQLASMNEYIGALPAIALWDGAIVETKPVEGEEEPVFSADTWDGLMRTLMSKAFTPAPAGAPQPAQVIRGGISAAPAGARTISDIPDGTTYLSLLEEIRDKESGIGVEWRFDPVWMDSSMTSVGFDFVTGTESAPHINESSTVSISLSEVSEQKISGFSSTIDSRELFNKVYVRYTVPSETEGEDGVEQVVAKWAATDAEIPLTAKYVSAGKELTPDQAEALKTAYINDGKTGGLELSFTVEEEWDKSEWILNIGKTVQFTGVPSTLSAGHTVTARCVGIEFSVQKGTIVGTFMAPQSSYPVLPKKKKKQAAFTPAEKVGWTKTGSKGAVVTPGGVVLPGDPTTPTIPPIELPGDWALDGEEWTNGDLWGSEGRSPDDDTPKVFINPGWTDFKATEYTYTDFDGLWPVDVSSLFQDKGNRLYGLDKISWAAATRRDPVGTLTHWNGGINVDTGAFNELPSLYIKKTYFQSDGVLGPIETIDTVSPEMIKKTMAEYDPNLYSSTAEYKSAFSFANWVVMDRYYLAISHGVQHYQVTVNDKWYYNGKTKIYWKSINGKTGKLIGDWVEENSPEINFAPLSRGIIVYGDVAVFQQNELRLGEKMKNLTQAEFNTISQRYISEKKFSLGSFEWYRSGNITPPFMAISDYSSGEFPFSTFQPIAQASGDYMPYLTKNFRESSYRLYKAGGAFGAESNGGTGNGFNGAASNKKLIEGKYVSNVKASGTGGDPWYQYSNTPSAVITSNVVNGWLPVFYYNQGNNQYINAGIIPLSSLQAGQSFVIRNQVDTDLNKMIAYDMIAKQYLGNPTDFSNPDGTTTSYQWVKQSRMFSFRGRLMIIAHSAANKLTARSVKMIELG
jgi:hypothetical protein